MRLQRGSAGAGGGGAVRRKHVDRRWDVLLGGLVFIWACYLVAGVLDVAAAVSKLLK